MSDAASISIIEASAHDDVAAARALFLAYANSLGFSLCFQGFDEELATLPGKYAPRPAASFLPGLTAPSPA